MDDMKPFIFKDVMLFESQFIRIKISSRNKSYYEDLFGEVLGVGEELDVPIGWLPLASHKKVSVFCPRCEKAREVTYQTLTKSGHSFCFLHAKQKNYDDMLGQTFGSLTIIRIGSGFLEAGGRTSSTFFCKCKCGNEVEVRMNCVKRGHTTSCGCYNKERTHKTHYNPSITDEERIAKRSVPEYVEWRKAVYERDNYTCKACSKVGGHLVAHHIVPYSKNKSLRFDVDNGITLCKACHKEFHVNFMGGYKVECDSSDLFTFIVLKKKE